MRVHRSYREMSRLIRAWERVSWGGKIKFLKRHKLARSTMYKWKKELAQAAEFKKALRKENEVLDWSAVEG